MDIGAIGVRITSVIGVDGAKDARVRADRHALPPAPVQVLAHGDALLAALLEDKRHTLPYASRAADSRYTVMLKGPWFHPEAEGRRAGATYAADDVAAAEVTAVVTRARMRAALVNMLGGRVT